MRDPYVVLGVSRNAPQEEIKKAYRRLAKELHPDRNPGKTQVAERFKEVSAAYHILGDEKLRARFDRGEIDAGGAERTAAHGFRRAYAHAGGDFNFENFGSSSFEQGEDIFADLFGSFRRNTRRQTRRGSDQKHSLTVSFLDAALGATRRVTLPSGRALDVKIPAGVGEGQQIRLRQQGDPGAQGGPPGDLLIEVQIEPHACFTRQGNDIHLELPVTLQEAVLGARITTPTIHGAVNLTIPKGSNTGTVLRLKGRGIAGRGGSQPGDQYVKLKIVLPERPDPELERLVASWAKGHDYDVRGRLKG